MSVPRLARSPWTLWVRRRRDLVGTVSRLARVLAQLRRVPYRGLTNVRVVDGASTLFRLDNWHAAGALFPRVPSLLMHCTDPTPHCCRCAPGVAPPASSATSDFGHRCGRARGSLQVGGRWRAYSLSACNWANFAPSKVRVFFWIARQGNTRTRALLHRHGSLFCHADEDAPQELLSSCLRLSPLLCALGVSYH
jgi:hypothetical protein